ncbi:MAG: PAS domain-containing protein [Clostridia bacterium]|nr:PAS domain-containing protein [Clostridia bacterium]
MKREELFKSILNQDKAPVVVCDMESTIVYMNPSAIARYHGDLTGNSIKDCHPAAANKKIDLVLEWFGKSKENNIVFTYHNREENKDVYMVALRDLKGTLIGYYEKHEFRNKENSNPYHFCV